MLLTTIIIFVTQRHKLFRRAIYYWGIINSKLHPHNKRCDNCEEFFNDGIEEHQKALKSGVIIPQANDKGLILLQNQGILKEVEPNDFYTIAELSHSRAVLLPKAIQFLNDLSNL